MMFRKIVCFILTAVMVLTTMTVTAEAAVNKPSKVKATCVSAVAAKVSCKSVSGATGYTFYVATKKKGKYKLAADTKTNKATVTGLKTGKTYYFKVKAYSQTSTRVYSKFSSPAKCKIVIRKPKLKVIDKCDCKVHLKMIGSPGAKGFAIYRSTKKNRSFKKVGKVAGFTYLDSGLKKNTKYYYKICATNGKKHSKYSKIVAVKTNKNSSGNGNGSAYSLANAGTSSYKSSLNGRKFLFLGSSITYGQYSGGVSFVEFMDKRTGSQSKKVAVPGTTMARSTIAGSYVERLPQWCKANADYDPDVFVCQLSLNDSFKGVSLGSSSGIDFNKLTGDDDAVSYLETLKKKGNTVAGAIDYITAYAYNRWPGCQVVFFTVRDVRQFKNYGQQYAQMRTALFNAQKCYGTRDNRNRIEIIDMWSNSSLTNLKGNTFCLYMNDINHPKKAGYLKQWTPEFEKCLSQWMPAKHTIVWKNADEDGGNIWKTDKANKHSRLTYTGTEPIKNVEDEPQYLYEFIGWIDEATGDSYSPDMISKLSVEGDATYVAKFEKVLKAFTVIWKDDNDNVLETDKDLEYEAVASYDSEVPSKEGFNFIGWKDEATGTIYTREQLAELKVICDMSFVACFEVLDQETDESQPNTLTTEENEEQSEEE